MLFQSSSFSTIVIVTAIVIPIIVVIVTFIVIITIKWLVRYTFASEKFLVILVLLYLSVKSSTPISQSKKNQAKSFGTKESADTGQSGPHTTPAGMVVKKTDLLTR